MDSEVHLTLVKRSVDMFPVCSVKPVLVFFLPINYWKIVEMLVAPEHLVMSLSGATTFQFLMCFSFGTWE